MFQHYSAAHAIQSSSMKILVGALLLIALAQAGAAAKVRGVRPDLVDKYQTGSFTCLDGSKSIDFSQVNDNYCDCPDGSDEPGGLMARAA